MTAADSLREPNQDEPDLQWPAPGVPECIGGAAGHETASRLSLAPHPPGLPGPVQRQHGPARPGVAPQARPALGADGATGDRSLAGRRPPAALHAAKAKRVIWLYMAGGPSHLETFDYKPKLAQMHGQPMPESFTKGQPIAQLQGQKLNCFAPAASVQEVRQDRARRSATIFPHLGAVADEICIVRSMTTEAINHDPAHTFMNTGTHHLRPAGMGSWLLVRPGQRQRQPARLRRADLDGQGGPEAADRRAAVAQRLPAQPLPGRRSSAPRATRCSTSSNPAGRRPPSSSATSSTRSSAQPAAERAWWTIPRSPRASPSTRWPSGCRPACRS